MTLREAIQSAIASNVAIGHFNISNLEQLKAITNVAKKLEAPVIIGLSEGEREYMGVKEAVALIRAISESMGVQLFINADHTHSLEKIEEAAKAGFDAVLFDGGKLPFEENIHLTKEAVKIAKAINAEIIVEGEMGYIGSSSKVLDVLPEGAAIKSEDFTKPEEAEKFVRETGVDLFSPAVGNIHGMLKETKDPHLDIPRIKLIHEKTGVPLVLHGGSGTPDKDFVQAIDAGVAIVHISTELRLAWRQGMEETLGKNPTEVTPYKLTAEALERMEKVIINRITLFKNKLT